MRFKDFYKEVATTTTSMGGANAQFADKIGKTQKRVGKVCAKCGKDIKDGEPCVTERRMNGDSYHKDCWGK
jgi:hypothetical protein